eukprot:CAMPEP_0184489596 /NCGR_PEP_ID=MMETSP0113_2-20130426/15910_1 /TAXON_ID=91329 /ORGANISM="Norrisiella sphaerica, Strain BC52" /LENGTH=280 /DNA_ID=CAMNT_0026873119 /DNA_START=195 /DNA_END=1037 /DNA_ORIENTATION=-
MPPSHGVASRSQELSHSNSKLSHDFGDASLGPLLGVASRRLPRRSLSTLLALSGSMAFSQLLPRKSGASIGETVENLFLYGPGGVTKKDKFEQGPTKFRRIPTEFVAALGDPKATAGDGAQEWGLWQLDPGPRGVWLREYPYLEKMGGVAPANWKFDKNDWWLEEHGLIMEKPEFPLKPGKYLVTGGRSVTTTLTVFPPDLSGNMRWELEGGSLYDVTHLPCRAARYSPVDPAGTASPKNANLADFPVSPGAVMPSVQGFNKQDYAVLFVIGREARSQAR